MSTSGGNPTAGDMKSANNLSDVASVATSKTNLKVGYATRLYSHYTYR